jgi:hypothetical protein
MEKVRPGQPVSASEWNKLVAAAEAAVPLLGGEDIRINRTPHGTMYNAKLGGGFTHPWRVLMGQNSATVRTGLINGQEPMIVDARGNEIPMSNRPSPHIAIRNFGPNNIGWIALELWVDDKYRKIERAFVKQTAIIVGSELTTDNPFFFYGLPGIPSTGLPKVRYPLARIQRLGPGAYSLFQMAMFNLNWICKPPQPQGAGTAGTAGQGALPRHFFWPV